MLKFEEIVKIGDMIRAYDFEPMPGRKDRFVEGRVFDTRTTYEGKFFVIDTICDTAAIGEDDEYSRVGQTVYVPMEVFFCEYDNRITVLEG